MAKTKQDDASGEVSDYGITFILRFLLDWIQVPTFFILAFTLLLCGDLKPSFDKYLPLNFNGYFSNRRMGGFSRHHQAR